MKITQPTINPTNKLTAAALAAFALETVWVITDLLWPDLFPASFRVAAYPMAILAAGWFIKDEANSTAVVVQTPASTTDEPAA